MLLRLMGGAFLFLGYVTRSEPIIRLEPMAFSLREILSPLLPRGLAGGMDARLPRPSTGSRTAWIFAVPGFESGTSGGPFHYRNNSAHRMCFLQSYLASSAVLVPAPEPRLRFFYWRKGVALYDYRNEIIRRRIVYQTLAGTPRTGEGNRKNRPET